MKNETPKRTTKGIYKDNENCRIPAADFPGFEAEISLEAFAKHSQELLNGNSTLPSSPETSPRVEKKAEDGNFFIVKTANEFITLAKKMPVPKMLFDSFWYEFEVCILFADTNVGKSVLAVQIGQAVASGIPIPGFQLDAKPQRVLYFDFELSTKQFQNRYSDNYANEFQFSNNFFRVELDTNYDLPEGLDFETVLDMEFEKLIIKTGAKIIIVDNLSYLKNETEKARNAQPLMQNLKRLKKKYGLSILVLAHTPKRDLSRKINQNDLQGSKMLANLLDSCFTIGKSHKDEGVCYLKQIKVRESEFIYHSENVAVCMLEKPGNFLGFKFKGVGSESEFLKSLSEKEKQELDQSIVELKINHPTISDRQIAAKLNTNHKRVGRVLKRYKESGTSGTGGTGVPSVPPQKNLF